MAWIAERGWSGIRINYALQTIRVPIQYAIDTDELENAPFRRVRNAFVNRKEKGCLSREETGWLVSAPVPQKYLKRRLAALCGLLCDMRLGEVRGLLREDVDLELKVIHIRHNWQNKEGNKAPKYGSFGSVPMPQPLPQLFEAVRTPRQPQPHRQPDDG